MKEIYRKTITIYVCPKCGRHFDSVDAARECLNKHCEEIVKVYIPKGFYRYCLDVHPKISWSDMKLSDYKSYPEIIHVVFADGADIVYKCEYDNRQFSIQRQLDNVDSEYLKAKYFKCIKEK